MALWSWALALPVPAVPAWHLALSPRASAYPSLKWEWGFPGGSAVKTPPAMQETWVQSLSREDALEEEMATHPSVLTWQIPWTEELAVLESMVSQRAQRD